MVDEETPARPNAPPGGAPAPSPPARRASAHARRDLAWVLGVTLALLVPFVGKAFTIDDPLFLWLGQQIAAHPLDFFGFDVNWYGEPQPMHAVTQNPPLVGYGLALAGSLLGWSEPALHGAFLLPALGAAAALLALARRFTRHPVAAALLAVATPAFVVSSTNVMCDTTLLAFFCGALWAWLRGLERGGAWPWVAGALAAAAFLSKYFGLALVPLFALSAVVLRPPPARWLPPLVVPLAVALGYDLLGAALYDHHLLFDAARYTREFQDDYRPALLHQAAVGLGFAGACTVAALVLLPAFCSRLVAGLVAATVAVALLAWRGFARVVALDAYDLRALADGSTLGELPFAIAAQCILWITAGVVLVVLAARDVAVRRDHDAVVLAAWLVGTLVFAAFLNWVCNARSSLLLVPPAAFLVARAVEARTDRAASRLLAAAVVGAVLAGLAAWADARAAADVRANAERIAARAESGTTWFFGHWGFQWYMELHGARPLDLRDGGVERGDLIAVPLNNTHVEILPPRMLQRLDDVAGPTALPLATMSMAARAGFYASNFGPLPFVFGPAPPEACEVYRVRHRMQFSGRD